MRNVGVRSSRRRQMLTVNVRMGDGRVESVFSAKTVISSRKLETSENVDRVECYDERNEPIMVAGMTTVEYGTVFVMNENGKTVATYHLPRQ